MHHLLRVLIKAGVNLGLSAEKEPDASPAEPGSLRAVAAQEDSVAEGPGTPELESAPSEKSEEEQDVSHMEVE